MGRSARRRNSEFDAPAPAGARRPAAVAGGSASAAHASPARDLQRQLLAELGPARASDSDRWSARRTFAFAVGASLLLWGVIGWSVAAILH